LHSSAKILVVDDERANTMLLETLLGRWGYENVTITNDSGQALDLCQGMNPDLLMLDLHMPGTDGFEIMAALPGPVDGVRMPVIVLTADASRETKRRALASGAHDLVTKPFDIDEVGLRVKNLLYTRILEIASRDHRLQLESRVAARTREVEAAHLETIYRLAIAAEYRDDAIGQHIFRVGRTTAWLAREIGLGPALVERYKVAATLHDVGKIAIPDSILLKPGKLNEAEWQLMKEHTVKGAEILGGSRSEVLVAAADIAATHHEKWDGSGYPLGLAGDDISLAGRLVALADVFDALVQRRPYKDPWSVADAIEEIEVQAGLHFDPELVEAFSRLDPADLVAPLGPEDRFFVPAGGGVAVRDAG